MIRRVLCFGLILVAVAALQVPIVRAGESYGSGVKVAEATPISKILADPDAYVGKTVRIEGKVLDVCPMKGCWMELAGEDGKESLKVRVEDGVMVFPVTSKGKLAVAEGTVEAIPMTKEQYVGWLEHLAEERGETFTAADIAAVGDGPFRILQLKGTGARID
ncbi:MAG: hypothetical protein QOH06_1863 [Acidobacteriota bacterium]|jgi:hypothetical protein|nr:hypothetical protein [Acidobacteriota bacterium]